METKEYRRDPNSKGLINKNAVGLHAYRAKRDRDKSMVADINTLKHKMDQIIAMLSTITPTPVS